MSKNVNSSDEKIEQMKDIFKDQRNEWSNKINELSKLMKIPEKLTYLEITIRNEIMEISEEKAKLLEAIITISKIIRKKKADVITDLKVNSDLKIKNQTEQNIYMESIISDYMEREELITMQIEYIDKTFNNLKDMLWGISRYIELNKMGIE